MRSSQRRLSFFVGAILCVLAFSGCSSFNSQETAQDNSTEVLYSEVTFSVKLPDATPETDTIYLDFLDEVTGLAFNITRYEMKMASPHLYEIKIPLQIGSTIKYRYSRQGSLSTSEFDANQTQVRYRIMQVNGPETMNDTVASWVDIPIQYETGMLEGKATDPSGLPVGNQLISVQGKQVISHADGTFRIDGLIPGIHNMALYSMDGTYETFQQGVMIAPHAITPAEFVVQPVLGKVKVTFVVQPPASTMPEAPIRLIANHPLLGNSFGDLHAGMSTLAARAPILSSTGDGKYTITMELPVGYDLRYKYTLGDGFWNAELDKTGAFQTRHLIIPGNDITITDTIETWDSTDKKPIRFEVQAPENTPPSDVVSIQFHTYAWSEPIPMWSAGTNRWIFTLSNPLQFFDKIQYRYCRNDQCDVANDEETSSSNIPAHEITLSTTAQTRIDTITNWPYPPKSDTPTTIVALNVVPRGPAFFAGIELAEGYSPGQLPYFPLAYNRIKDIGANWVILTPSWHYPAKTTSLPIPNLISGIDPSWQDITEMIKLGKDKTMQVALFPQVMTLKAPEQWWKEQSLDGAWWDNWFSEYNGFLKYYATLAAQNGASALILGGAGISPALPGGLIPGTINNSGVPDDALQKWKQIIQDVRQIYQGQIIWAIPSDQLGNAPEFLNDVDQIYVLFNEPLSGVSGASQDELKNTAAEILDMQIYRLYEAYQRPIILGIYYPSVKDASMGCANPEDACLYFDFSEPVDIVEQANIYTALLVASNERSWINGFVSRGYFAPVAIQDKTASINGKPAADILWYWFPRITAPAQ